MKHQQSVKSIVKHWNTVKFAFQGGLVDVKTYSNGGRPRGGQRGKISEFSRASRKRILKLCARVDWNARKAIFITLTYKERQIDGIEAKRHLRAFLKRLYRHENCKNSEFAAIWRMELHPGGHGIHFHVIVPGMPFVDWREIATMWQSVDGRCGFTHVVMIRNRKMAGRYVSKYIAKSDGLLDTLSYSATDASGTPDCGRWWGVERRKFLPLCELIEVIIADGRHVLARFKRYMNREFKGIRKTAEYGGFLLVENAYRWYELLKYDRLMAFDYAPVPYDRAGRQYADRELVVV